MLLNSLEKNRIICSDTTSAKQERIIKQQTFGHVRPQGDKKKRFI
jgi:hypothetical protein